MTRIFWITPDDPPDWFPPVDRALDEPDGLLAAGGDLSEQRLLHAYSHGIFPWYQEGEPILWWSPNPRTIFVPGQVHVARRLAREIRQGQIDVRLNTRFLDVMRACAAPRAYGGGTWITADMRRAYAKMHAHGHAHSIEAFVGEELVGGLYGIAIGRVFFGESMFSTRRNASKIVLVKLSRWLEKYDFALIDAQVRSAHLESMGSQVMPRSDFVTILARECARPSAAEAWRRNQTI